MRTTAPLLLAVACLGQQPAPLSREQMEADLRQLVAGARVHWAYAEHRRQRDGVDLDALLEQNLQQLATVRDQPGFVRLVRGLVAAMQDGHAFVAWPGDEGRPFRRWPFTFVDTDEGLCVDEVLPSWNGTPVPLCRGDVLLEVGGVPIAELRAATETVTNASTPGARRRQALPALPFVHGDPVRYKVRRGEATPAFELHAAAGLPSEQQDLATTGRELDEGVGCIRIATFACRDQAAWAKAAPAERSVLLAQDVAALRQRFAAATGWRALVLDLRGNGGGTDLLGMEVAACLLPRDSVYYGLASRGLFGGWRTPHDHKVEVAGEPPRFTGQLVVLIDEDTFSAADNLCRCLDDLHPDVTFVGRPTGGGTGAPRARPPLQHSGIVVSYCTMRVYGPDGGLIEGIGTTPDVPVARTRTGWLAGVDEDLAAARKVIRAAAK